MKFTYLKDYLENNCISLRDAGKKVGRSGTAVKSWCDGLGLQDKRVRKKIAMIMGVTEEEVMAEVIKYMDKKNPTVKYEKISDVCEEFKERLKYAFTDDGNISERDFDIICAQIDVIKKFQHK